MININEVAHLYPQCKIWIQSHKDKSRNGYIQHDWMPYYPEPDFSITMHGLRPLSSLTDAEKCELYDAACTNESDKDLQEKDKIRYANGYIRETVFTPAQTLYLLKKSIDLFGLIDSKQAEKLEQ